jgi:hypothetical protein
MPVKTREEQNLNFAPNANDGKMQLYLTEEIMRKITVAGLIAVMLASGISAVESAYVIKLRNGNEYITARYWQEGAQLLFDTYGGVFGVDRGFVLKIEKSDKLVRPAVIGASDPSDKSETISKPSGNDVTKEAPGTEAKAPAKKDENDPVYKEFDALKAQAGELSAMLTGELDDYLKKVAALIAKIRSERKVNQYLREYSELSAMANDAEAALKSRR